MQGEDLELFKAFVAERGERPTAEAAPVAGIKPRTLRRYIHEKKVPSRLTDGTRVAMARFLTSRGDQRFAHLVSTNGDGRVRESVPGYGQREHPTPEEVRERIDAYVTDATRLDGPAWVPELLRLALTGGFSDTVTYALVAEIVAGGRNETAYGDAMGSVQRGVWLAAEADGSRQRREGELRRAKAPPQANRQSQAGKRKGRSGEDG